MHSRYKITPKLSIAEDTDHTLEMQNYMQINHLMEITNASHIKIVLVTVSQWIAKVKATSPTSNVRRNMDGLNSQSASWKYGK